MSPVLLLTAILLQTPLIDRGAVDKALDGKKVEFDLDYLNTMPVQNQAYGARTDHDWGHLKLYRECQKDPLSFPDRILAISDPLIASRNVDSIIPIMANALDRPVGEPPDPPPCTLDLSGLPAALREPVGLLASAVDAAEKERQLAFAKGRPQGQTAAALSRTTTPEMMQHLFTGARILLRAVERAKPALKAFQGDVDFRIDGKLVVTTKAPTDGNIPLIVSLGGDKVYDGDFAHGKDCVRLLVDVRGNDTYKGSGQGSGEYGIGILYDMEGNDSYEAKQDAQGSATCGVGILVDEEGEDKYVAHSMSQGAAVCGIGLLVDGGGDDTFRGVDSCMGFGFCSGFGLLLDLGGDDTYHMNDPDFGDPLENAAPQDAKHCANSGMGGGWGDNEDKVERRAGGLGMLVDAQGEEKYESGCWAQGVGYFCGIGALVDYDGNDRHRSWVYTTGSGAHGGYGIVIDRGGDSVYDIGGWNCLGMAVDFGMGFFLKDGGSAKYIKVQSGLGWCTGLGIALFQDRNGDDEYVVPDVANNMGWGKFYEKEDYNSDGKVEPAEKRHFGVFLDLGGMDRYPAPHKNGTVWHQSEYAGGYDAADPPPGWKVPDGWEELTPIEVFRMGRDADAKAKAEFAAAHGLLRFLGPADLTSKYGDDGKRLAEFLTKASGVVTSGAEALLASVPKRPAWLAREAKAAVMDALGTRRDSLLSSAAAWEKTLAPILDARKALNVARAEAQATPTTEKQRAVARLWGARGKEVRVDPALREAATELDLIEGKFLRPTESWKTKAPLLAANAGLATVTLQTLALTPEERGWMKRSEENEAANRKARLPPMLDQVNQYRRLMGRPVLAFAEALNTSAGAQAAALAKGGKAEDKPAVEGFSETALVSAEATKKQPQVFDAWLADPAKQGLLLDAKWTHAGVGGSGAWGCLLLGVKK